MGDWFVDALRIFLGMGAVLALCALILVPATWAAGEHKPLLGRVLAFAWSFFVVAGVIAWLGEAA